MIEVLEDIACGTIQRVTPAEFDKVNPLRGGHTSPGVGQPNQNAGEFAEFPACREVRRCEKSAAINAAWPNEELDICAKNAWRSPALRVRLNAE